jgi:hypothetical protein
MFQEEDEQAIIDMIGVAYMHVAFGKPEQIGPGAT